MKIVVINGSPSGCRGTSAQYVSYLQQQLPQHSFETLEVARRIDAIERDRRRFDAIVEQLRAADAVVWCFPVYVMLVPAQLKRFIELLFQRVGARGFEGKIATAISTSAHFYDHTAHDYIGAISVDLGMSFVRGFSADHEDLLAADGRANLIGFARDFLQQVTEGRPLRLEVPPLRWTAPPFDPELPPAAEPAGSAKVVVVSDADPDDHNLSRMIDLFERSVGHAVDRLNLRELPVAGGCLGCMRCADDGVCGQKDGYAAAFDALVAPADVVIFAAAVRDRYFSARFKAFLDRHFRNGHRPPGKRQAMGFLVSGPLQLLGTLREVMEAHVQLFNSRRLGFATDEATSPEATAARVQNLARAVDRWVADPWFDPPTFLGVGGLKVFRDLVYENRGVLTADHRYYRDHGLYDFPPAKKTRKWWIMSLLLLLKRIPFLRRKAKKLARAGKLLQHRRVLEGEAC